MSIGNYVLGSTSAAKTAKNKRKKENAKIKKAEAAKRREGGDVDENKKLEEFKKQEVLGTDASEKSASTPSGKFKLTRNIELRLYSLAHSC